MSVHSLLGGGGTGDWIGARGGTGAGGPSAVPTSSYPSASMTAGKASAWQPLMRSSMGSPASPPVGIPSINRRNQFTGTGIPPDTSGAPSAAPDLSAEQREAEEVQRRIESLQFILTEMRSNAKAIEQTLYELQFELKQRTQEAEHLRHQQHLAAAQERQDEPYNVQEAQQVMLAKKDILYAEEDIKKLGDEKIALLRKADSHISGGSAATAADSILFSAYNRSDPAMRLGRLIEQLPNGNVERLQDAMFFDYCKATLHAAVVQFQRRRSAVDVESALLTGLHHAGHRVNMARILQAMDEDDLKKL